MMIVRTLGIVFSTCLNIALALGQDAGKIESDRPGKAQTAFVIPGRTLQIETGFKWKKEDEDQREMQHPEVVIKSGLLKRLELRTQVVSVTDRLKQTSYSQSGLQPVEVGIKALITEQKGVLPHASLTAHLGIPDFASKNYTADKVFTKLRLNFESNFTENVFLEYNVAAEWDGFEDRPVWMAVVSPHVEIGENLEIFVEAFSDMQHGKEPEVSADGGVAYWISKNVMIDVSGGVGISKSAPKSFVDVGFSFRLK